MADSKVKVVNNSIAGGVWFGGWLFTIGFLKLSFFKGLLGLLIWPYYLGDYFSVTLETIVK
ncbi:MAG: hypothetical protein R3250_07375 [Melioribacteraceae bacterium]|nr:hypothetical protein [Melioribacteraceae bacterium]